jgi:hypothetical protein
MNPFRPDAQHEFRADCETLWPMLDRHHHASGAWHAGELPWILRLTTEDQ